MTWCFKAALQLPKARLKFVDKWPLADPNELLFLLVTYLALVFKIGPYVMEKRNPLQLKPLLMVYNAFQVFNCAFLSYRFFAYIMEKGLFPKNCDHDEVTTFTIAALYWKFMITKTIDLFDTIFFVLRKKQKQITFLHVYHHVFIVIVTWSSLKYDPSDHWAFMAMINCGVHTLMYLYYGIAAMGTAYVKYLWWKKYLTMLQMIQFVLVSTHIVIQTYSSQCPIHGGTYWIGLSNLLLFGILFADFYRKRYAVAVAAENVGYVCSRRDD